MAPMPFDAGMQAFEDEMRARHRSPRMRPAGTRRTDPTDNLTGPGAHRLAEQIRDFWKLSGFDVVVVVEPFASPGMERNGPASFSIRSDMIAALPRAVTGK
jgi:hypothetical protein